MAQTDPVHPWTEELTGADLELLGAQPVHRADPVVIGPYRVLARLGAGGMGRLYLGRRAGADGGAYGAGDLVAVKVIRPEYAEDERFRRRFEREVEVVRRVHGTYTAELVGSGFDDGERLWMATAYVPGFGLDDALRRWGPLPAPVVWRLAAEVAEALATIAATGVVHRDLKPSNVLLGPDGARVIDFGVAHTADASVLTVTGQQVGTPAFMSPEQAADGRDAGTASDVFSLGSVLAHAATGKAPFGEGSTAEVVHRVIYSPPDAEVLAALAQADVELAELVGRCLEKEPERRPAPDEVAALARQHEPAGAWPAPLAEAIAARAAWTSRARAASPMDQPTVLRRGPVPPPAAAAAAPRRRRGLVLGLAAVAAVVAVAVAVFLLVAPGSGAPASSAARTTKVPVAGASSQGSPSASASSPVPQAPGPPPGTTAAAPPPDAGQPPPPREHGSSGGGGGNAPAPPPPAPQPPQPGPVTPPPAPQPPPPPPPAQPWKSCRFYSGTALTQYGDKGDRVRQVQCILKARGYDLGPRGVDGDFGPDTRTAVRRFQQAHHLDVDGQVGKDTWPALRR
ncbi:serine/threonine-protein kinase [Streptomyces sp. NPDC049555]|uniref:serine/threonine-protein kinase n=1 Tax=Streptomyces sp. NPDC049555 TaxID=3154930 RepID=UPI00342E80D2